MKRVAILLVGFLLVPAAARMASAAPFQVVPRNFDPAATNLVESAWLHGIGCPTNQSASSDGIHRDTPYNEPACTTGDSTDKDNQGLLLDKTGPTPNYAAAVADLKNLPKANLTELGYDIRKPRSIADPSGSHCGAGAPRFDVVTTTNEYFVGCASPPPTAVTVGTGFLRLRWGGNVPLVGFNPNTSAFETITGTTKVIQIVFDEGQDTGPDNFGLAVLDNIDVNTVLVGHGPNANGGNDGGDGHGDDGHGNGDDHGKGH